MRQGFIKVAAVTPNVRVADVEYNTQEICKKIDETVANGAKIVVFPELCVTGYTCGDLFAQSALLKAAENVFGENICFLKYFCVNSRKPFTKTINGCIIKMIIY